MVESKSVLVVSGAQYVVIPGALMKQGWFVLNWDIHVKVTETLSYMELVDRGQNEYQNIMANSSPFMRYVIP